MPGEYDDSPLNGHPLRRRPDWRFYYARSIFLTLGASASDTRPDFRSLRFLPWLFLVRMWRFMEWPRLTLPVAVSLNRFTAPRLLLSFSFFLGFLISFLALAGRRGGQLLGTGRGLG